MTERERERGRVSRIKESVRFLAKGGREGEREPAATAQLHPRRRSDLSRPRTLEWWGRLCSVVKSYPVVLATASTGWCKAHHTHRPLQLTLDLCDISRRRHGLCGHLALWAIDKGWVSIQPKTPKGINRDVLSRLRSFAFNDQKFDRVFDFRTARRRLIKLASDNVIGEFLTARRSHDLGVI